MMRALKNRKGFTVLELVIYIGLFALVGGSLVGILTTAVKVQTRQGSTGEVSGQLDLVFRTVSRLVRESSVIEKVYEGTTESTPCSTTSTYCSVKLRMPLTAEDPTVIRSDANGVYVKQGTAAETSLTNNKVSVDSFKLAKKEVSGGHAILDMDLTLRYVSDIPAQAIARSVSGAVGRVSAATFDDHLLPNANAVSNVGSSAAKWNDGWFAGTFRIGGNLGVGMDNPSQKIEVNGGVMLNTTTAKPSCSSLTRGLFWVVKGAAGVKDNVQVCAKDATDAYAWRVIY